jgi:glycosyltransferase involved in cell wall biosynthesis
LHVAVVHGYFLHDSGSGIYARELARELVLAGHDVTLVCQERSPDLYDFIDSVYDLDDTNTVLRPEGRSRSPLHPGRCRLVRPNLGGRLLVYVDGPFPGFAAAGVKTFQEAPTAWIEGYLEDNIRALATAFSAWPPAVVLAGHAMMQPYVVRRALAGREVPYNAIVHGSELNFSVKRDARLAPFTIDGLLGAAAVVTVSKASGEDLVEWAGEQGVDLASKVVALPPGVDMRTFAPAPNKRTALEAFLEAVPLPPGFTISPEDDILAFAGRLLWTKGIQHAVAALPLVAARRPRTRLLVAGYGPAREPAARLAELLGRDDIDGARRLLEREQELRTTAGYGPVLPSSLQPAGELQVAFLGHLTSAQLARLMAAADVSLAPSVFPEAFGLVTIEALAAGALPIAGYHSGLASAIDVVSQALDDPVLREATEGSRLTESVSRLVLHSLSRYPTSDPEFRMRLHGIAAEHFDSWERVAWRHLELALGQPATRLGSERSRQDQVT